MAFFTKKSLVHPYPVIEDQLDLDDTSSGSPHDLEATFESNLSETPSNSRRRKEVTGTGLGLFSVSKKASKFGGYVAIQDNVPEGSLFSVIIPHMKLSEGMVKLDTNSMNKIKESLPHDGVNASGVCIPPPNPNRLDGIEFVEITGAIDTQSMNFDIDSSLPPISHHLIKAPASMNGHS